MPRPRPELKLRQNLDLRPRLAQARNQNPRLKLWLRFRQGKGQKQETLQIPEQENAQLLAQSPESRPDNSQSALRLRFPVYVEPMTQVDTEPVPSRPRAPTHVHPTTRVDIETVPPLPVPAPRPTVIFIASDARDELEQAHFAAIRDFINELYLRCE